MEISLKFLCFAQKPLARPFGCHFLYPRPLLYGKPLHQPSELFRRDFVGFGYSPWPFKPAVFQPFIYKQETIALP